MDLQKRVQDCEVLNFQQQLLRGRNAEHMLFSRVKTLHAAMCPLPNSNRRYNIGGDPDLILSCFRSDFEPLLIRFASKPGSESDQKRLKTRSGSGLVRKGGCFKLGLDLARPNIPTRFFRNKHLLPLR